ncbi:MAG: bifunctional nuclease family protein [Treponema sp.]|jgi:bifunctional DNase/RNase|nr:bifunctional nuclease family protein [Treponema sp.]
MEAEIWTIVRTWEGNAVLLKLIGSEIGIPIFVDPLEARSILIGYGKMETARPLIHDVILELAHQMGLELFQIEIHDIKNSIFHARLFFSGKDNEQNPLILNSRPADACALAVRSKCPIQVSRKVVEQVGVPVQLFMEEVEGSGFDVLDMDIPPSSWDEENAGVSAKHRSLQGALDEAIASEEYEQAAEIRDILSFLEKARGGERGPNA